MEIPDTPVLHAAEDLTLTTWFRVDDPNATWQTLLWQGNLTETPGHGNREFGLFYNSGGYIHLSSTPVSRVQAGHLTLDTPADVIGAGQWYHVAAVINSSANSMTIYHNGNPDVRHLGNPRYQRTVAVGSAQPWLRVPWFDR